MRMIIKAFWALCFAVLASNTAQATVIEQTREVTIEYRGTLSESVLTTYRRNGREGRYGAIEIGGGGSTSGLFDRLEPYPLSPGEEVVLTVTANVPTRAFIDANGLTPDANGNFRFFVTTGGQFGVDSITVSEPFNANNPGIGGGFVIDYNYDTDSYVIADIGDGNGNSALIDGLSVPTYQYDPATGLFTVCGGTGAIACDNGQVPSSNFVSPGGNINRLFSSGTGLGPGIPTIGSPEPDSGPGFFDLIFDGGWFVSFDSSSGGPTPVPAPGMLLLFGVSALLVFRRRKVKAV